MTVLIPRARTIGVRLSAEEYSALERFCLVTGARSMSEVARTAICKFVRKAARKSPASAAEHATQLRDLEQRVSQFNAEIAFLKAERAQHSRELASGGVEAGGSADVKPPASNPQDSE